MLILRNTLNQLSIQFMKIKWSPNKLPYIISIIAIAITIKCAYNVKLWRYEDRVIVSDAIDYYGYLPATFIYHDITLDFIENYQGPHKFLIWYKLAPNKGKVIMMSMGLAILYSPFFFIGHLCAYIGGYDTGGYSEPYRLAIIICAIFYFALGLYFLSKLLIKFFNPYVGSWVLLITVFGSNLFCYVTYFPAMAHTYNFVLITIFIWYTIRWYENRKLKHSIILGILLGIISLARPTNIVIVLFFVLWKISSFADLKNRVILFFNSKIHFILMIFLVLLVWTPQLLYWKKIAGSFLYYSYGEENGFFFNNPRIIRGFFDYRTGWLVYSPAMIFSVLGMFLLWKNNKEKLVSITVTFCVFIYVIFSWWCWWYGGSFGLRAMIDIYGLLSIPMAVFFTETIRWNNFLKISVYTISVLLFLAGIHHTNKYAHGSIHYDSNTKESFWSNYFKVYPSPDYNKKLRAPDYIKAREGIDAYVGE
jgi:hypothetical protein